MGPDEAQKAARHDRPNSPGRGCRGGARPGRQSRRADATQHGMPNRRAAEGLWAKAEDEAILRALRDAGEDAVPHGTWPDPAGVRGRTVGAVRLRAY